MSHGKERKEKNCLNCNARVFGKYCHVCGQENVEPKESAWDLIVHFFNDITHFEGKFISSLRYLIGKPGFLTTEYVRGRRASYMNPVRMYVFTSAFFFIIFFSFFSGLPHNSEKHSSTEEVAPGDSTKNKTSEQDYNDAKEQADSVIKKEKGELHLNIDTSGDFQRFNTIAEYDSVQKTLPFEKRKNWISTQVIHRLILVNKKYHSNWKLFFTDLFNNLFHSLPKILFFSLPLFALILQLLYIRRKQFYYVGHLIFTIHLFVFTFLFLVVMFSVSKLQEISGWGLQWIMVLLWIFLFIYLYKAMKRVYQQSRTKTIFKFFLLLLMAFFVNIFLFMAFFSYSFFNM